MMKAYREPWTIGNTTPPRPRSMPPEHPRPAPTGAADHRDKEAGNSGQHQQLGRFHRPFLHSHAAQPHPRTSPIMVGSTVRYLHAAIRWAVQLERPRPGQRPYRNWQKKGSDDATEVLPSTPSARSRPSRSSAHHPYQARPTYQDEETTRTAPPACAYHRRAGAQSAELGTATTRTSTAHSPARTRRFHSYYNDDAEGGQAGDGRPRRRCRHSGVGAGRHGEGSTPVTNRSIQEKLNTVLQRRTAGGAGAVRQVEQPSPERPRTSSQSKASQPSRDSQQRMGGREAKMARRGWSHEQLPAPGLHLAEQQHLPLR